MTGRQAGRAVFTTVAALSLVVLFSPASGVPSGFTINDKLIHFLLFASLAVSGRLAELPLLPLALGLVAYAGVSEVVQSALPIDRDGDLRDAVADWFGVLAGLALVAVSGRRAGLSPPAGTAP